MARKKLSKHLEQIDLEQIINKLAVAYAHRFKFACFDYDDIKQEISKMVLDAITRYDPAKSSLMTFLHCHVKKRLINFKRDNFERKDKPCLKCPYKAWDKKNQRCKKYQDVSECEFLSKWTDRNTSRKNIMSPTSIDTVDDTKESFICGHLYSADKVEYEEYLDIIDLHLPLKYRKIYVMTVYGIKIDKKELAALMNIIKEILAKHA